MMMMIYSGLDDNNDEKLQHLRLSNNNTSFEKENDPNTIIKFAMKLHLLSCNDLVRSYKLQQLFCC